MTRFLRVWWMGFLVFMFGSASARAQISPGPLARAHRMLEGPNHCTDCHDTAKRPPEFKCLDCHREIRQRLDANRGFHAALVEGDTTSRSCVKCHSDHNGADFQIIHWDPPIEKFDHRKAGYTLVGKHATIACRDCHQPAHVPAAARAAMQAKDFTRSYLGLSQKCADCHADEHHGQFAASCETCHDSADWKNAAHFDHNKARFSLTGAHERVACDKCHMKVPAAKPYVKYKGIQFSDCTPCHSDPHKGSFAGTCRSCHGTDLSWKPTQINSSFNHSVTKYPLLGKHASVSCNSCHHNGDFKAPLAFANCTDCHTKDPHHGQFAERPDRGACESCHTVSGFKPSTFGLVEHQATRFPLVAQHLKVQCVKCHLPNPEGVLYRIGDFSCAACHQDVHGGQFRGGQYQNRCESCHTEETFKPSTFTIARHAATKYPLTGAHAAVACMDCHRQRGDSGTPAPVPYHFDDTSCTACHDDPHHGQFAAQMKTQRLDGNMSGCQACHTTSSWHELQGFDHSATRFPLTGAHRAVVCEKCHKPDEPAAGIKSIRYTSAPVQCSGCHADIHGGQFSDGGAVVDCTKCHGIEKWKPSNFNHETMSTFKLEGAHRRVTCGECHRAGTLPSGIDGVVYRSTPTKCSACHGGGHWDLISQDSRPGSHDRPNWARQPNFDAAGLIARLSSRAGETCRPALSDRNVMIGPQEGDGPAVYCRRVHDECSSDHVSATTRGLPL